MDAVFKKRQTFSPKIWNFTPLQLRTKEFFLIFAFFSLI